MARFGFCGPTYRSLSPNIDAETAMNLYPEKVESPNGRSALALIPTDGLSVFGALPAPNESAPGIFTFNGRTFVTLIEGDGHVHLAELAADGSLTERGDLGVPVSSAPAIWAANQLQIAFVVAGTGKVYCFTLGSNTLTTVTLSAGSAITICYLQGFFLAQIANSNKFQVSNLEDGTTWPAINVTTISEYADNSVTMIANDLLVLFLGQKAGVPYYPSGALFPFAPVPGAFIEEGAAATYGIAKLDNTILWIGGNVDQGLGVAYRLSGYTPQRISDHGVERAWQDYTRIDDAISYAYQAAGHKFWHIFFPTANASWRYDISTGMWHEVGVWDSDLGIFTAHQSMCHTFNFGLHLVGDPFSANIYSMSPDNLTDNGTNIRRVRRSPYVAKEHDWVFHRAMEILAESGLPTNINAPSDSPQFFYIADANGNVWSVTITDTGVGNPGVFAAVLAPGATPSGNVILADNVNQSTFWQLQISLTGVLSGIQVAMGVARTAIYQMATGPNFLDSGLEVNQAGNVSAVAPAQHTRPAQLYLRWSDDGAHTWSNYYPASLGKTGEFTTRSIWRRLGKSRNRVYELSFDDPVSLRIVDAFLDADPSFKPTERLTDNLRKGA